MKRAMRPRRGPKHRFWILPRLGKRRNSLFGIVTEMYPRDYLRRSPLGAGAAMVGD